MEGFVGGLLNAVILMAGWWQEGYVAGAVFAIVVLCFAIWMIRQILLGLLSIAHGICRRTTQFFRGRAMRKRETQREFVKQLVGEIMTDGLEDAVFKGQITTKEATGVYRQLSRLGFWDCQSRHFMSPPPHPIDLKEDILNRLPKHVREKYEQRKRERLTGQVNGQVVLTPAAQEIEKLLGFAV